MLCDVKHTSESRNTSVPCPGAPLWGFFAKFNLWLVRPNPKANLQRCNSLVLPCQYNNKMSFASAQPGCRQRVCFWTNLERDIWVQVCWKWLEYFFHVSSFYMMMFLHLEVVLSSLVLPRCLFQTLMVWVLRWMLLPTAMHVQACAWLFLVFFPWKYSCRANLDYIYFGWKAPSLIKAASEVS